MIETDKIIEETKRVFSQSAELNDRFSKITSWVNPDDYYNLHKSFLTPLSIKIDCDLFLKEIERYQNYFVQWGTQHTHLPRYGLALVNEDGILEKPFDPINGSLYEWNNKNPHSPLIEIDCRKPTEVMNLQSLKSLDIFEGYWARSNIFKWEQGAEFKPHIDTFIPSPWLRLWATNNNNIVVRYYIDNKEYYVDDIEPGRIYLIDTSLVHDAYATDTVYQLFLSVVPEAVGLLKSHL